MIATRLLIGATFAFASAIVACAPPTDQDDPHVVPPITGQADIEQWFAAGYYLSWTCEAAPHPADSPSPHGLVRLCANPIIAPDLSGEHPVDSSMVIEIHDPSTGAIVGHGAQRHTAAGTSGEDWYWFMVVPADSATPHDATGLAADGWGFDGPAHDVCTACHIEAGTNGLEGHDFVWVVP